MNGKNSNMENVEVIAMQSSSWFILPVRDLYLNAFNVFALLKKG